MGYNLRSGGGAVSSVQGLTGAVVITDANLSTSDITANNVSTSKHGFAPKSPNDATKFLDGTGNYSTPSTGAAKLNFGFDFRKTSGFVADPTYAAFVTDQNTDATMAYPKTFSNAIGQSIVGGWDAGGASVDSRDRVNTYYEKWLAGMAFLGSGVATFRCDLPATGVYQVETAWGDPGNGQTVSGLITDNGTTRITIAGTTNGSTTANFVDSYSHVNINPWIYDNVPVLVNFTSTVFRLALTPGSGNTGIIHLRLVQQ